MAAQVELAHDQLHNKTGAGSDYLGWIDLPDELRSKKSLPAFKQSAKQIQSDSEVLIVIGIGGSYLGARAALEMLSHSFYNLLPKEKRKTPEIYFVGNNISSTYVTHLLQLLEGKDFSVNVISKSGTTTEPAIAFRIFREAVGEEIRQRKRSQTDLCNNGPREGRAEKLATEEGYETFVIPDDVGGRYSVLTAVGLLPIAAAGIDIEAMMQGAADAQQEFYQSEAERK